MPVDLREQLQATLGSSYILERELGGGGMSRVFLANDARLDRRVVVKVLHPDISAGLSAERFEREVRLAARLQHPHVVPLLSAGELNGLPYYTMPYVEGESLRVQLAREGAFSLTRSVRLLREMADALAYSHGKGVVHRDLKPENVLLSGGHAMVADFGIAKALATASQDGETLQESTAVGVARGTPAYMAPEQAAADPATDHRADLYALGLIAYEVLTGQHPFVGRSPQAMLAAQLTEIPPSVSIGRDDVPAALAALVDQLLSKTPDDRPTSAQAVVRALDTLATPEGTWVDPVPRKDRRAQTLIAVGIILVLLTVAGAWVWRSGHSPVAKPLREAVPLIDRRVAIAPLENQTGDSGLKTLGQLASDWITQGVAQAGFAEVVDPQGVRSRWTSASGAVELGTSTGARVIVVGSYYRDGDTLRFLTRIIDAANGDLLLAIDPVSAAMNTAGTGSPRAVAVLRERVLAALASHFDARPAFLSSTANLPPSLAAYQYWASSIEKLDRADHRGAIADSYAARRLDSTYVQPIFLAALGHQILGEHETTDSLHQILERMRDRLSVADQRMLDEQKAENRGDWNGALQYARELVQLRPGGYFPLVLVSWQALFVNRPREALSALERLSPAETRQYTAYSQVKTLALHLAGDYSAELTAATRGRTLRPDYYVSWSSEARALAALGRVSEAERRRDTQLELAPERRPPTDASLYFHALELRAHGHPDEASALLARAIRWMEGQSAGVQKSPAFRRRRASVLYAAGRWDESRRLLESLVTEGLATTDDRGTLGALAARRGDRVTALVADSALSQVRGRFLHGWPTYHRARIAALLGDRDRAVSLLGESIRQGIIPILYVHAQPDFESLRDLPAYKELVRPKG